MDFLPRNNKVTAIQIRPENYQEITEEFPGYSIQNGALVSADGSRRQDNMWLVSFEHEGARVDKCISDSLFRILFEEKPVEHYTLGEILLKGKCARKDDYPDGDYVEWNGFTWVQHISGISAVYSPTPEEITEKCWLPA